VPTPRDWAGWGQRGIAPRRSQLVPLGSGFPAAGKPGSSSHPVAAPPGSALVQPARVRAADDTGRLQGIGGAAVNQRGCSIGRGNAVTGSSRMLGQGPTRAWTATARRRQPAESCGKELKTTRIGPQRPRATRPRPPPGRRSPRSLDCGHWQWPSRSSRRGGREQGGTGIQGAGCRVIDASIRGAPDEQIRAFLDVDKDRLPGNERSPRRGEKTGTNGDTSRPADPRNDAGPGRESVPALADAVDSRIGRQNCARTGQSGPAEYGPLRNTFNTHRRGLPINESCSVEIRKGGQTSCWHLNPKWASESSGPAIHLMFGPPQSDQASWPDSTVHRHTPQGAAAGPASGCRAGRWRRADPVEAAEWRRRHRKRSGVSALKPGPPGLV